MTSPRSYYSPEVEILHWIKSEKLTQCKHAVRKSKRLVRGEAKTGTKKKCRRAREWRGGRGNERKRENSAQMMTSLLSRGIYLSFDLIRVYLCWDFKLRIFFCLKSIAAQLARFYINFYSCQWLRYLFSSKITELEGTKWKSFGFMFVWIQSLRPKG